MRAFCAAKRSRRMKAFAGGAAVDRKGNYYVEWSDLDSLLTEITDNSRWLLITGPWQSGKTSLMYALAEAAQREKELHVVITTLSTQMIAAANDISKHETEAADAFFDLLAGKLEQNSRGFLRRGKLRGMAGVLGMFQNLDRDVIWCIDEASLLNEIRRTLVLQTFLSDLRSCKQECVSRNPAGSYYLRSFILVGTPKLKQLIGDLRMERIQAAEGGVYVPSSVHYDPEDPLGESVSPLSLEKPRPSEALTVEGIVKMLSEYSTEHDVQFRLSEEGSSAEGEAAMRKLSKSIVELTGGHAGMVGCCCEYLATQSIDTFTEWQRHVRIGHVSKCLFYFKTYARAVSNVVRYTEEARQVILECIQTGGSASVDDWMVVLRPLNDGVLEVTGDSSVAISCGLLLSAFLEDCALAPLEALPPIGSFVEVIQATFPYMNYERLTREEVLNANGQPSEYVWQSEFLLSLKFVLENGYKAYKYTIMVEAKKRDKNGERRTRVDFILKNSASPPKGFEVQGAWGEDSIISHIRKTDKYRLLHGCEMNYVYFQYGNYGVDAKAVIEKEAPKFRQLQYWFVQFLPDAKQWRIEQLRGLSWVSVQRDAASSFPRFQFQRRRALPI